MSVFAAALCLIACASGPPPAVSPTAAAETPASSAATTPSGGPSPAVAAPATPTSASEVLERGRSRFDACYAQARATDPRLARTSVQITFAIDKTGTPTTVDLHYRNRFGDTAKDCMRDAALSIRFPEALQGTQSATIAFSPQPP